MIEAIVVAVVIGLAGVVVARTTGEGSSRTERWIQSMRQAGVTDVEAGSSVVRTPTVSGRHGSLTVAIESYRDNDTRLKGATIVVRGLPDGLEIQRDAGGLLRPASVATGHELFDQEVRVTGSSGLALALLDAATRERVLDVFCVRLRLDGRDVSSRRNRAHLSNGTLTFDCPRRRGRAEAEMLDLYLVEILKLADALALPEFQDAKLLANVRDDPEPGVRLANLRELLGGDARAPALLDALRIALDDGDESVQLEAAIALGASGRTTLLNIATRAWSSDTCAARAVGQLRSALPPERAVELLRHALQEKRWQTAEACLETLGRSRSTDHLDAVTATLLVHRGEVAAAAARALGRIGTAQSIPLLRDAEARFPRPHGETIRAIHDAIAAIRSRLGGVEQGQVSLAGDDEGHVSLVRDEAGQVSIPRRTDEPA